MLSNEWWEYHLTENGWSAGSYKTDFTNREVPAPVGTVLTRRFCETLSHGFKLEHWFEDVFGNRLEHKELLRKYPNPERFKNFKLLHNSYS